MSSLPEMRSGATGSKGWSVIENPPIFRAWTAGGDSYGFRFHALNPVVYSADASACSLTSPWEPQLSQAPGCSSSTMIFAPTGPLT